MRPTNRNETLHQQLETQTQEFLARGGKIQSIPRGLGKELSLLDPKVDWGHYKRNKRKGRK